MPKLPERQPRSQNGRKASGGARAVLKVYHYAGCDSCRKALKFLESRGVAYEPVAIVETPPSIAELERVAHAVGDFKKLFNTSGQVYRELGLGAKVKTMSEGEALQLLHANGKLIKRPFVIGAGVATVGFREEEWKKAF